MFRITASSAFGRLCPISARTPLVAFSRPSAAPAGFMVFHSASGSLWKGKHNTPTSNQKMKKDINIMVDTMALKRVPKEAYALGLAGTLPYLATSLSTLYLGWDMRQAWAPGLTSIFTFTHEHAAQWLAFLEPVQLGYGAVIISFLGAIHWGMEFNERSPVRARTRFRYSMGVIAPAIAWPTTFMPFEYALISQVTAFAALYYADAKASARGWVPAWYGSYRFLLTFIVCSSIVLSLFGRQKVVDSIPNLLIGNALGEHMKEGRDGDEGGKKKPS